ncbi:isoprenyl transferase [Longirhabdus pacifica]|uniref:isoprenyl transferase n=1 Tax=Longirhabdus pacifica TaxID=2305227 RepID=UPI0010088BD2|nr:isoprenyl transferase [Longirhabdus pacifica]
MWTWKRWLKRSSVTAEQVKSNGSIPSHIAIIMDGNGRWAKRRGLPRSAGHRSGMKNVKHIAQAANKIGVDVLTLYTFSTENWKRPQDEVDYLMKLPEQFFEIEIKELEENNVQVQMIGDMEGLPDHTLKPIQQSIERTKNNTGMILNFAVNYGSRTEMVAAIKQLAKKVKEEEMELEQINEEYVSLHLQTKDLPDPDLLIRTSGEQRISNFLLWQLAYTEFSFSPLYWPDYKEQHLYEAIEQFQTRGRRYGGL